MAESILVTGKKISSMELVTNVTGSEKIPTGQPDDLAVTPNQIADHTIARGDLASQEDLSQVEVSLGTQIADLTNDVNSSDNSIRGLIAAEEAARIAADNLKVDKEGSVSSVAGRVGDVVLAPSDVLVDGFGSQGDVNKYVPKPFLNGYTYGLGERVVLNDGEVVKSTIDGNLSDPNVGMTGWVSTVSDSLSDTIQTFNTPEAGVDPVSGVADGAYFNARSSSDDSYIVEYQNVGGVPVPSGKTYPSSEAVQKIADYTALPFVGGKTYRLNERVHLVNGDIVKAISDGVANDPNIDMAGWLNAEISIKKSVADMLGINNPKDGQTVRTLSYHAGLSKGGNTYRYEPSRQLENDGGSVIDGWVVQDKTALTVWDFGYKDGDDDVSRTSLSNALKSTVPLQLLDETLTEHIGVGAGEGVLWQTITQNKLIFGCGRDVSVINGLRLQTQSDVFIAKDFSINGNGLNYALFTSQYNFLLIDNFSSKGNLDAVLVMGAKSAQSKALVRNSYSENSSRIGFTSDVGAKNVTFENCRSFNCRQGFHAEEEADTTFIDCIADACGNNAMPAIPDYQPPEYAGGFRLHKYTRAKLIRCKNINKNGTKHDQLGGGGTGLYIEQCEGLNFRADFGATETYRDIEIKGLKDGGIVLESFSPKVAGRIIVHDFDGGSLELASSTIDTVNVVTYAEFVNVKANRLQIASQANDATIHMDNIYVRSPYFNSIRGFTHHVVGDLMYSWDNSDGSHYPNLGFRFDSNKAKTFTLQSFRSIGASGGYHLSIENFPSTCKPIVTALIGEGDAYGIASNVAITKLTNSALKTAEVSTTYLSQASDSINTQNKYLGRDVYNPTIGKFMKATGLAPTSTWVSYDGATTITPA